MHAFVTVYPSYVEYRLENGHYGSEPLADESKGATNFIALGTVFAILLRHGVESIEIRAENWDD